MMIDRYVVVPRTLCFVFYDDTVLLIEASSTKDWAGTWDPVGGHIEAGESIIESAEREIKEESGLTATHTTLAGVVHVSNFYGKDVMMFVVRAKVDSTEVLSDGREGTLHWVPIAHVAHTPVFPDVPQLLKKVISETFFTARSRFEDGKLIELVFD